MEGENQPSPMLKAIDLVRENLNQLGIEDLERHAADVLDTIAALNDYINGGNRKSHHALLGALRRSRKLCAHMAHVRALIQARRSRQAMVQGLPSTSAPAMPSLPGKVRRSRVIRALQSADNAASGHIQVLCNGPQGRGAKLEGGGEAKEAGAGPHTGEASMQAKR